MSILQAYNTTGLSPFVAKEYDYTGHYVCYQTPPSQGHSYREYYVLSEPALRYGISISISICTSHAISSNKKCSIGFTGNHLHGDGDVYHVLCLIVELISHTVHSNETGDFHATMIYVCLNRSVQCSMGSLGFWGNVPSWSGTLRQTNTSKHRAYLWTG